MGDVLIASNENEIANKWFPYYYKPFQLGRIDDGTGSTDGNTYITQNTSDDGQIYNGVCFHSHNCNFYYIVTIWDTGTDAFRVAKYDLQDNLVETIYASHDGSTYYEWDNGLTEGWVTIDIGVAVMFKSTSSGEQYDSYKITLPSYDTMERRKIYHGGYAAMLKMPIEKETATHSDIIPINLKEKNLSISFNPPIYAGTGVVASSGSLTLALTEEVINNNIGVSFSLAWNVNKDGAHSTSSSDGSYSWASGETWAFGYQSLTDADPLGTGANADFPTHMTILANDTTSATSTTGTVQSGNITTSAKAGYAKIRLEFLDLGGSEHQGADNQFWPCILTTF